MSAGRVEAIWISPVRRQPLTAVSKVRAVPGLGLEGDRYFLGKGSFSRWPGTGRAITLIEREVLDAVLGEHGIDLRDGRSRRNIETSGVGLVSLLDRTFRIGTAVFRGVRQCEPCALPRALDRGRRVGCAARSRWLAGRGGGGRDYCGG